MCLAENFYPDHVSIKWTLGSKEITEDVATDPYAFQNKTTSMFSMSSRLKVLKSEFTPKNTFTCTVTFTDATGTYSDFKDITGTGGISLDISWKMKKMKLPYVNTIHLAMHAKIIFIFVYLGLLIHYYFWLQGVDMNQVSICYFFVSICKRWIRIRGQKFISDAMLNNILRFDLWIFRKLFKIFAHDIAGIRCVHC